MDLVYSNIPMEKVIDVVKAIPDNWGCITGNLEAADSKYDKKIQLEISDKINGGFTITSAHEYLDSVLNFNILPGKVIFDSVGMRDFYCMNDQTGTQSRRKSHFNYGRKILLELLTQKFMGYISIQHSQNSNTKELEFNIETNCSDIFVFSENHIENTDDAEIVGNFKEIKFLEEILGKVR